MHLEFPKPSGWADLENLTVMLAEHQYGAVNVQRYGRPGQSQNGVDVVANTLRLQDNVRIGYQCKLVQSLTQSDVESECSLAKNFTPALDRYVIVTSLPRDAKLQSSVLGIPDTKYGFPVVIWFWDDLNEKLNRTAEAAQTYFAKIMLEAQPAAAASHAEALRRALDRKAFQDSIRMERDVGELIEALAATVGFMRTGYLYDNRKNFVESTVPPWKIEDKKYSGFCALFSKDLDALYQLVLSKKDDLRDTTTNAGSLAANEFTFRRSKLLDRANREFDRHGLPAVPIPQ